MERGAKRVMRRKALDNVYLHKDFHGALSCGIDYLDSHFGEEAVRQYLHRFTRSFYAPLIREIERRGLPALRDHFERIYGIEGGEVAIEMTERELTLRVKACPAVTHMRRKGYKVARLFKETVNTVNGALCEGTGLKAELLAYDDDTGRSTQRFTREKR